MASNIDEALGKAQTELENDSRVLKAVVDIGINTNEPGDMTLRGFNVFHTEGNGTTFSRKQVYIDLATFNYRWHYGGFQFTDNSKIENLLDTIKNNLKNTYKFDWVGVQEVNKQDKSAVFKCLTDTEGTGVYTYIHVYLDAGQMKHLVVQP